MLAISYKSEKYKKQQPKESSILLIKLYHQAPVQHFVYHLNSSDRVFFYQVAAIYVDSKSADILV
jgi:hypothetical protein